MRVYNPNYNPVQRAWYRVGMITNAAGVEIENNSLSSDFQQSANDGDHLYTFVYATGSETTLTIGGTKTANSGIFDLYIDGVLDSAGYDLYAAVTASVRHNIVLANPLNHGYHTIEFRVNGKNGASGDYIVQTYGMRLR